MSHTVDDLKLLLCKYQYHFDIEMERLNAEYTRLNQEIEENIMSRRRLIVDIENLKKRINETAR